MSRDWNFFPYVMCMHDVAAMRQAVQFAADALEIEGASDEGLPELVFRYYERGLVDPRKLAALAVSLLLSRTGSKGLATATQSQMPEAERQDEIRLHRVPRYGMGL